MIRLCNSVKTRRFVTLLGVALSAGCVSSSGSAAGGQHAPLTWNTGDTTGDTGAAQTDTTPSTDAAASGPDAKPAHDAGSAAQADTSKGAADAGSGAPQTCAAKCGAKYDKTLPCQCNDKCSDFGNCCADYFEHCKPALLSCKGRCDEVYTKGLPCQCGWECAKFGTCCSDYLGQCAAGQNTNMLQAPPGECDSASDWVATQQINDGDTFQLKPIHGGDKVRFLIVNTPELKEKDCYAVDAQKFTLNQIKNSKYPGKGGYHVCLTKDANQPDKDKYGRLLRYVYYMDPTVGKPIQLNARLVRLGYGRIYYPFAQGNTHEKIALLMQQQARIDKIGGWGACADWK